MSNCNHCSDFSSIKCVTCPGDYAEVQDNICNKKPSNACLDCRKCIIVKYVRLDITDFIFLPIHINHSKVLPIANKIISAGFLNITKMNTFGDSISLNKKPKQDDIEIIKLLLRGNR